MIKYLRRNTCHIKVTIVCLSKSSQVCMYNLLSFKADARTINRTIFYAPNKAELLQLN